MADLLPLTQQQVRDGSDGDDDLFPDAWITAGEALDQALDSLGLALEQPKPRANLGRRLVSLTVSFFLWALSLAGRPAR